MQTCFFLLLRSVFQSIAQVFLLVLALSKLLVLSKNQLSSWYPIIQMKFSWYPIIIWNSILIILFEKGMNDRVPLKGNCVNSGASLVAETLSWLLITFWNLKDRLSYAKLHYEFQLSKFYFQGFFHLEDPQNLSD